MREVRPTHDLANRDGKDEHCMQREQDRWGAKRKCHGPLSRGPGRIARARARSAAYHPAQCDREVENAAPPSFARGHRMKRRSFGGVVASAIAWPAVVRAQARSEAPKVGYVAPGSKLLPTPALDALTNGIRASGDALRQVEMVVRFTEGDPARLVPMVREVIDSKVAVFVSAAAR